MPAIERAPIASTLDLADMGPRLNRIRRMTQTHLRAHRLEQNMLRLTYDSAVLGELEQIVALERECCAFLDFTLRARSDEVELLIVAPKQEGSDAQWLFSQFLPETVVAAQVSGCACCKS